MEGNQGTVRSELTSASGVKVDNKYRPCIILSSPRCRAVLMKPRRVSPPFWVDTFARRIKPPLVRSSARALMKSVAILSVA